MAKKILIVDDEPDILKTVEFRLLKSGYQVVTAEDGEKALEMAKEHIPDLILLDLRLPGKNGLEVCAQIKSDDGLKHIPVVLLTASSGVKEREFQDCGNDGFILKPFHAEELLEKVKALLFPDGEA